MRNTIQEKFENLQNEICKQLENLDGIGVFQEDLWQHREKGGGKTRIIQGKVIEKGGVNFSAVEGKLPPMFEKKFPESNTFFATGISIVLHPSSPMCPIIHANIRYFETDKGIFWFGGGIDLTPHYIDVKLAQKFHLQLKKVCDQHHPNYYSDFKTQADEYFFLAHRNETRGIGGIFFDYLDNQSTDKNKEELLNFVLDVGKIFVPAYQEQILATKDLTFNTEDKKWQAIRRGRYVEFNLLWDKGTRFGIETGGRTESILMSLPPVANWDYQYDFQHNQQAIFTQNWLKKAINWIEI